jgi:hypothetical protein
VFVCFQPGTAGSLKTISALMICEEQQLSKSGTSEARQMGIPVLIQP